MFLSIVCCVREYVKDKKTFIIKKGSNFSENKKRFVNKISEFSCKVDFEQYKYEVPKSDIYDWNKLFGFSFLRLEAKNPVHEDSARWGWRWLNDKIEITPYCYVDSQIIKDKKVFVIENKTDLAIKVRESFYDFYIDNQLVHSEKFNHNKRKVLIERPYFGGNNKAPNDIIISFLNLTIK